MFRVGFSLGHNHKPYCITRVQGRVQSRARVRVQSRARVRVQVRVTVRVQGRVTLLRSL